MSELSGSAFAIDRSSVVPLYAQLAAYFKNQILDGALPYGSKLPSENELVAKYALSRMTVRSAFSALENEKFIEKRQGKGAFVCYQPSTASGNIDVLLDISYTYFAAHYIQSISAVLTQRKYRFIIHDTGDSQQKICSTLLQILNNGSSGIIVQPSHRIEPMLPELCDAFDRLNAQGIPYIMLDHVYDGIAGHQMVFDDYGGGRVAAEYLCSLGHRSYAMICCSSFYENRLREAGFRSVLTENGLPSPVCIEDAPDICQTLLTAIEQYKITALFCFNDEIALKAIRTLHAAGLRVPDDISVVGYDDTVLAGATEPLLTSVIHPKDILGRMAAESLISMIEKKPYTPDTALLAPRLHIRASCAPIKNN